MAVLFFSWRIRFCSVCVFADAGAIVAVGCQALAEFKAAGVLPQHQQQHAKHRCTFEALVLGPEMLEVGVSVPAVC
jgi:hypothetical protein